MLWWCKKAVLPQSWHKIVAGMPALHPDCCYRWRWVCIYWLVDVVVKLDVDQDRRLSQRVAKDSFDIRKINFLPVPQSVKCFGAFFSEIWRLPLGAFQGVNDTVTLTINRPFTPWLSRPKALIYMYLSKRIFFASDEQEGVVIIVLTSKEREKLNHIIKMIDYNFGLFWQPLGNTACSCAMVSLRFPSNHQWERNLSHFYSYIFLS